MAARKRAASTPLFASRPKRIRKPSALALEAAANKATEEQWKEDRRKSRAQMREDRAARTTQKAKTVQEAPADCTVQSKKTTKTANTTKKSKKPKTTKTTKTKSESKALAKVVKDVQVYRAPLKDERSVKRSIVASKQPIPLPASESSLQSPILLPPPESPTFSIHSVSESTASSVESVQTPPKRSVQSTPMPSMPPWHALQRGLTRQNSPCSSLIDALRSELPDEKQTQAKEPTIPGRDERRIVPPSHGYELSTPMNLGSIETYGEDDVGGTGGAEVDHDHQTTATNISSAVAPICVSVKRPLPFEEALPLPKRPRIFRIPPIHSSPTSLSGTFWWRNSLQIYSQWLSRPTLLSEPLVRSQPAELEDSGRSSITLLPSLPLSGQSPKPFTFPWTLRRRSAVELSQASFSPTELANILTVRSATPLARESSRSPPALLRICPTPELPKDDTPTSTPSSPEISPLASSDSLFPPTPPSVSDWAPIKSNQDVEDPPCSLKKPEAPLRVLCHRHRPMLPVPLALPAPVVPPYMEDIGITTSCQFVGCPRCYYAACQCPCHKNPNNSFAFVGREEPEDWVDFDTALVRMIMDIKTIVDNASTTSSSPVLSSVETPDKSDIEMAGQGWDNASQCNVRQVSPFGTREQNP